jgi:phospholipase C
MNRLYFRVVGSLNVALLVACSASPTAPASSYGFPPLSRSPLHARKLSSGLIQYVVIIVQENRTFDNLFQGFPGANTASSGLNSKGRTIALRPESLTAPWNIYHSHHNFETEYAGGQLNGFDNARSDCGGVCLPSRVRAYSYVPQADVGPYWTMAQSYTIADDMFQSNEGPSFPAHQYLISGTSSTSDGSSQLASENPGQGMGGCDSPYGTQVTTIDATGQQGSPVFPCFNRTSLMDLLDENSLTWHYYQAVSGPGLWNAPDAVSPTYNSSEFSTDVVVPSSQFLTDIGNGVLSNVTWITPTAQASDHPLINDGSGPDWVASVVNAIGESQFWDNTAIFVVWDDWGGWYDHVAPPIYTSYELGFRVPMLVISPYANTGYVSHTQHEFGSILKFTEEQFGLPSMGTTDERADDLSDCFNFNQSPTPFVAIPTIRGKEYFLAHKTSSRIVEDP